jgi:hypothetical protein
MGEARAVRDVIVGVLLYSGYAGVWPLVLLDGRFEDAGDVAA